VQRERRLATAFLILLATFSTLFAQFPQEPTETPAPTPTAPQVPTVPRSAMRLIVLDPAHGGTDPGARGPGGLLESDVVLTLARAIRSDLERRGLRVLLTREGNANPSFDERSMRVNAQPGAVFISLHVASTGRVGTVRAYYPSAERSSSAAATPVAKRPALLRWDEAQNPYLERSRRLAELLQVQLGQRYRGSPEVPREAAVRQLRTITAPAIAVEISSVAAGDAAKIVAMAPDLAAAIARAIEAFRPLYEGAQN